MLATSLICADVTARAFVGSADELPLSLRASQATSAAITTMTTSATIRKGVIEPD